MENDGFITADGQTMRRFVRACGHEQRMIWKIGDTDQAERYQATACVACRMPAITFANGWGRTR